MNELTQDWAANDSGKARIVMLLVRVGQRGHRMGGLVGRVIVGVYKILTTWILGVEIPPEVQIGPECKLFHPVAIVVNPGTVIGARCTIRNSVTIGNVVDRDGAPTAAPVIGDDVELGSGCLVLGPIELGNGVRVGAGSVVVKSVPAGCTVVGNPARILDRSS